MEHVKHWWLSTSDTCAVFTDQQGNYKAEWEPGYFIVEFTEGQHPDIDMEALAKEISGKVDKPCHWVYQPK
jgi:hypothetical protein